MAVFSKYILLSKEKYIHHILRPVDALQHLAEAVQHGNVWNHLPDKINGCWLVKSWTLVSSSCRESLYWGGEKEVREEDLDVMYI